MTIYEYTDYRLFLKDCIAEAKKSQPVLTYSGLSQKIRMQTPSFSKAINGSIHFTADQIHLLAQELGLNSEELEYLELLAEWGRSSLKARKDSLMKRIAGIQRKKVLTPESIDAPDVEFQSLQDRVEYFSSPWIPLICVFLTIPFYQSKPSQISSELQIPETEFQKIIALLKKLKLIEEFAKGKYHSRQHTLHTKDLSSLIQNQQNLTKILSLQRATLVPLSARYGLAVTFSTDEKVYEEIRQILVKAAMKIQEKVAGSNSENVYQLNLDLFPWTQRKG